MDSSSIAAWVFCASILFRWFITCTMIQVKMPLGLARLVSGRVGVGVGVRIWIGVRVAVRIPSSPSQHCSVSLYPLAMLMVGHNLHSLPYLDNDRRVCLQLLCLKLPRLILDLLTGCLQFRLVRVGLSATATGRVRLQCYGATATGRVDSHLCRVGLQWQASRFGFVYNCMTIILISWV